jgi:putative transposase
MGGHKIHNQNSLHFLTITTVGWVDIFTRSSYRDIVINSLRFCQLRKGLVVNAYVIMSNHIHLIAYAREGYELSAIIRDFKKFTATTILKTIIQNSGESRSEWMLRLFKYHAKHNSSNDTYQLWQKGNHPIELVSPKWIWQKLNYIHLNPVRAGLVENPEDYLYSSAGYYERGMGILEVEILDLGTFRRNLLF